ncbi:MULTISPECIES: LysR family transcriptional regulator [unclassified Pseudomonas]|uniref:LysR family transcriptional regulator n=1 Tax=unclassified Pseudomonas TaxID=196821 RepID=UPI000877502C|nr:MULTISPECIES: LysR family transcriptional regulator [unclassified Pseudomonas]SCZ74292.1 DNA-binding transcriptional regulator, LysR family [Pseudomonas sp. NFPP17]SDA81766.1 DNA-binding transcriptional regulator, LysR family [Pseudomonas sp. NFPP15]SEL80030.1 DNA-binding transcriptional regulator, LysR family [Pseudomonas sp. NFPP18]SFA66869.1 DNA-binding transcriptional regulator, LysR family [Pseudomonas sp. NFPP13]SFU07429.1 DNA-binding transcriptional regulator, LysR family [Pseudomona
MINFRLIRHLWLFLAVAEEQNFSRAAKRLGMSQPPLTEQIQVLEHALKVKLFDRSRRGAQLTPVGAAILPAVRKFAEQLERLELAVHEAVAGQTGLLTIGAITSAMLDVLPPLIEQLKADYPQLTVSVREIDSVEAIPALEAGDIDLAFARLEGDLGASVRSLPLTEDRLALALPADHPLASRSRISLSSLANEPLVMFSRRVSPVYFDNLIATCRDNGFSPRVLHEVRSVASQIAFVSCGQGIALVPASLKTVAPDNVVLRPLSQRLNVVTTAMAWNSTRANPLVQALVAQFQGAN